MESNGAVLVNKPEGITSAEVVRRLKRKFGIKSIGHAGTLDPMATGLLVVLCGKATKLQFLFLEAKKRYRGVIRLGLQTDTDDITGQVVRTADVEGILQGLNLEAKARELSERSLGKQLQVPPSYSAVKVAGERSYKLARSGEAVELTAREIEIYSAQFTFLSLSQLEYDVQCSKGTYVRSLARDIGEQLGTLGTLETICRLESEPFSLESACSLDTLLEADSLAQYPSAFLSLEQLTESLPAVTFGADEVRAIRFGQQQALAGLAQEIAHHPLRDRPHAAIYDESSALIAVAEREKAGISIDGRPTHQSQNWRLRFVI